MLKIDKVHWDKRQFRKRVRVRSTFVSYLDAFHKTSGSRVSEERGRNTRGRRDEGRIRGTGREKERERNSSSVREKEAAYI